MILELPEDVAEIVLSRAEQEGLSPADLLRRAFAENESAESRRARVERLGHLPSVSDEWFARESLDEDDRAVRLARLDEAAAEIKVRFGHLPPTPDEWFSRESLYGDE